MVVFPGEKNGSRAKNDEYVPPRCSGAGHAMLRSGAAHDLLYVSRRQGVFFASSFVIDKFGYFSSLAAYACSVRWTSYPVATVRLSEEQS